MTRIDNWRVFGDGLIGEIRNHDRQDEFKMKTQFTSPIVELNEAEGWCQTQNTRYTLGEKMKSTVRQELKP